MSDSAGWTDAQVLATVGGVFGLVLLVIIAIALFVWRQSAGRTAAVKAWASERGLMFDDGGANAPDLSHVLGEVTVAWQIRGSLKGQPVTLLDTTRWVGRNVGTGKDRGQISQVVETFVFYVMPKPLPTFEARSFGGAPSAGASLLAFAQRFGVDTGVKGQETVAFDTAPGVQVHGSDVEKTRALLQGAPITTLAARAGWRVRGGGSALLVSWCPDPATTDAAIEAARMDEFVSGAQALAAVIRQAALGATPS